MGVGAGLYMYDVVVEKCTFAISCPGEFLSISAMNKARYFKFATSIDHDRYYH